MRLDTTLAIAPSLETGLASSAATVARWDIPCGVALSLLQRRKLELATLEVKREGKLHGVQRALFQKRLEDGTLARRNQLRPGKSRPVPRKCCKQLYQTTCMEEAACFMSLSAYFMSIFFQGKGGVSKIGGRLYVT